MLHPLTWLAGIMAAVITTVLVSMITPAITPLSDEISQAICELHVAPPPPQSAQKFTLLISPLVNDDGNKDMNILLAAFRFVSGFNPVTICQTVSFKDWGNVGSDSTNQTFEKAAKLLSEYNADLLVFGYTTPTQIKLFEVNENGGCDLKLKPISLDSTVPSPQFLEETEQNFLPVTMAAISGACLGHHFDIESFETRINKLHAYITDLPVYTSDDQLIKLSSSFADGASNLYHAERDDPRRAQHWVQEELEVGQKVFNLLPTIKETSYRYLILETYTRALADKYDYTRNTQDAAAALAMANAAIAEAVKEPPGASPPVAAGSYSDTYSDRSGIYGDLKYTDQAIADDNEIFERWPNNQDSISHSNRCFDYSNLGDNYAAMIDANKAIQIDPKNPNGFLCRASVLDDIRNYDGAIADYTTAINIDPGQAGDYTARSGEWAKKLNWTSALTDANTAIKLDPSSPDGYYARASVLIAEGDIDAAKRNVDKLFTLGQSQDWTADAAGKLWYFSGKWREAISNYNMAIQLNPVIEVYRINRANAWNANDQWDSTISDMSKLIATGRTSADVYYARGRAYAGKKQWRNAIADVNAALDFEPNSSILFNYRGVLNFQMMNYDEAIADFTKAIRIEPTMAPYLENRGNAWSTKAGQKSANARTSQLDLDNAVADYTLAVKYSLAPANDLGVLAGLWDLKQSWENAVADCSRAVQLGRPTALTLANCEYAWEGKGDWQKAIATYDLSIHQTNGANADDFIGRATDYYNEGAWPQSTADFTTAICLWPNRIRYLAYRARSEIADKNLAAAKADLAVAIGNKKATPIDLAAIYAVRGIYDEQINDVAAARTDYEAALRQPLGPKPPTLIPILLDNARARLASLSPH